MKIEYKDQSHEMWLEGISDDEPILNNIIEHAKEKGFLIKNLEVWFDSFQLFWRFNADLEHI